MTNNDAIANLLGVRRGLQRRLSQQAALALAVGFLTNAVMRYGDQKVMNAFQSFQATLAQVPPKTFKNENGEMVHHQRQTTKVGHYYDQAAGQWLPTGIVTYGWKRGKAMAKYKNECDVAKRRLKNAFGSFEPNSYQHHLYNALCGLEQAYTRQYKQGLFLVLDHLAELDQRAIGTYAEQIAAISNFLEAEDQRSQMEEIFANLGQQVPQLVA